jgi:hypothetical protein
MQGFERCLICALLIEGNLTGANGGNRERQKDRKSTFHLMCATEEKTGKILWIQGRGMLLQIWFQMVGNHRIFCSG